MNVQALNQMTVTSKPYVPTLKDLMYVAVLVDIRAMGKTAQVRGPS